MTFLRKENPKNKYQPFFYCMLSNRNITYCLWRADVVGSSHKFPILIDAACALTKGKDVQANSKHDWNREWSILINLSINWA